MKDSELDFVIDAIKQISMNYKEWQKDYVYDKHANEFTNINSKNEESAKIKSWFEL
jgi:hypothetical protein